MPKPLAEKIINGVLDKGLGNSTFRDKYPEAYDELMKYREDMVLHTNRIIVSNDKTKNKEKK